MAKGRLVLDKNGVREMLKSAELQAECMQYASEIAGRAGTGYEAQTRSYPNRNAAAVVPVTDEAVRDILKNNTLLKAVGR